MQANPVTISATFEGLDGMTRWIDLSSGPLYASLVAAISSTTVAYTHLGLSVDGGPVELWQSIVDVVINYPQSIVSQHCWEDLSPGRHKVRGLWCTSGGQAAVYGLERSLLLWGPGVSLLKAVSILTVGDSITEGYLDPTGASYRGPLQSLLATRGIPYDFVGPLQAGPVSIDRFHAGYAGWRTDQLAAQVSGWIASYQPHVAIVVAGTNDVVQGYSATENRIGTLLDTIAAADPTCLTLASTLVPFGPSASNPAWGTERNRVNAALPAVVAARQASDVHVTLVDAGNLDPATDLADAAHPNASGRLKMATAFDAALLAAEV